MTRFLRHAWIWLQYRNARSVWDARAKYARMMEGRRVG
jgi:hypothetical protein